MFHQATHKTRMLLPLAFFSGLIMLLVVSESLGPTQATTVIVNTPELDVRQDPAPRQELPRCKVNEDCPLPTTYCNTSGKCERLNSPVCDCAQPQVLRCYEPDTEKARFLFCPNGCETTEDGAICE